MNDTPSELPSLAPQGGGELGSLSQVARDKKLRSAKYIFIFVGIVTILVNGGQMLMVDTLTDMAIEQVLHAQQLELYDVDPQWLAEVRGSVSRTFLLFGGGAVGLGFVFLVLAAYVKRHPVPITVSGLSLYVASMVIFGLLDPATLAQGIIIKIVIIVAMVGALRAALASQAAARAAVIAS